VLAAGACTAVVGWWIVTGRIVPWAASSAAAAALLWWWATRVAADEAVLDGIVAVMHRGELERALVLAQAAILRMRSARGRAFALELAARAHLGCGRPLAAHHVLAQMPPGCQASAALRGALLLLEGRPEEACALLEPLLSDGSDDGVVSVLAEAYVECGRLDDAAQAVLEANARPGRRRIGQPVFAQLEQSLLGAGAYGPALAVAAAGFERFGSPDHAYNHACALCGLGRHDEAIGWLERALDAGYEDIDHLDQDADLTDLRAHPRFAALYARLRDEAGRSARLELDTARVPETPAK
jgi:tetratricopeptide (TPR) repeat protein